MTSSSRLSYCMIDPACVIYLALHNAPECKHVLSIYDRMRGTTFSYLFARGAFKMFQKQSLWFWAECEWLSQVDRAKAEEQ